MFQLSQPGRRRNPTLTRGTEGDTKMIKYYCDTCGDEVKNDDDLVTVGFFKYFLSQWSREKSFGDVCPKCQRKITEFIVSWSKKQ